MSGSTLVNPPQTHGFVAQQEAAAVGRIPVPPTPLPYQGTLFLLWLAYGGYYLGRTNLALATPVLVATGRLSYTAAGLVTTIGYVAYAVGQPLNGVLIDQFGAKLFLLLGLGSSALLNLTFGFVRSTELMVAIWGANGFFQACGWPALMKIVDSWLSPESRGKPISWLATSAYVGNALSWVLGSLLVAAYGWRPVFWMPAGLQVIIVALCAICLQETPPLSAALRSGNTSKLSGTAPSRNSHSFRHVLANPLVWQAAILLACTNLVSNSLLSWLPTFLTDHRVEVANIGWQSTLFPITATAGTLLTGWLFDLYRGGRQFWLLVPVFGGVASGLLLLMLVTGASTYTGMALVPGLILIGLCVSGASFLITGIGPLHITGGVNQASTVGIIESAGYLGASSGTFLTGWLVQNHSWHAALLLWLTAAVLGLAVSAVFAKSVGSARPR